MKKKFLSGCFCHDSLIYIEKRLLLVLCGFWCFIPMIRSNYEMNVLVQVEGQIMLEMLYCLAILKSFAQKLDISLSKLDKLIHSVVERMPSEFLLHVIDELIRPGRAVTCMHFIFLLMNTFHPSI